MPATANDAIAIAAHYTCTCFRLRKLSRTLTQRYDAALAPAGLNINQYSILRRADRTRHTIGSLAAELGMDRTTLSRDLKHLLDAGWLRTIAGDDARQKVVAITTAGKRVLSRAYPLWQAVQSEVESLVGGGPALAVLHAELDAATMRLDVTA